MNLAQGLEPNKHAPSLILAHRYLNIPRLLYYTDPLYDLIRDRDDITNPINKDVFDVAIKGNHSLIVSYYLQAIQAGSTNVVKVLLAYIDPTIRHYALLEAIRLGRTDIARIILTELRLQKVLIDGFALINASSLGHTEIVKLLLKEDCIDPNT